MTNTRVKTLAKNVVVEDNLKPYVVFKSKKELVQARVNGQLEFSEDVEKIIKNFVPDEVLGATISVNSPATVLSVKPVSKPEDFFELAL